MRCRAGAAASPSGHELQDTDPLHYMLLLQSAEVHFYALFQSRATHPRGPAVSSPLVVLRARPQPVAELEYYICGVNSTKVSEFLNFYVNL